MNMPHINIFRKKSVINGVAILPDISALLLSIDIGIELYVRTF
jgi:hypothetical protein